MQVDSNHYIQVIRYQGIVISYVRYIHLHQISHIIMRYLNSNLTDVTPLSLAEFEFRPVLNQNLPIY